jgi:F-type H+-transporting ATPase subunit b
LEALGLNLGYILLQICMFGIVFVTLRAWVYKPVLGLLQSRREKIAQGLEDARVAAEARSNAEREAARIISESQAKAALTVREATERAELASKDVKTLADAEAAKARELALLEVEQERDRILAELRTQVAALAISAAQKIIGETLDARRQHALVDEFFSGVKAGKVVVLQDAALQGSAAEVISALPLTEMEQATVKSQVLAQLGAEANIAFRVDPGILGGLIVKVGDKVVDGSVAGQLQVLRQNLR